MATQLHVGGRHLEIGVWGLGFGVWGLGAGFEPLVVANENRRHSSRAI
jgi:hypothetical protein